MRSARGSLDSSCTSRRGTPGCSSRTEPFTLVALSGPMTVLAGRRHREIVRGDAIVVPQGLPPLHRAPGRPPGAAVRRASPRSFPRAIHPGLGVSSTAGRLSRARPSGDVRDVIPADDVRHRLLTPSFGRVYAPGVSKWGWTWDLLSALAENPTSTSPARDAYGSGHHVGRHRPRVELWLEGGAAVGVLTLSTELVHEAAGGYLGSSRQPPSPEYDPENGVDGLRGG